MNQKAIAQLLDVSISTVSLALSDSPKVKATTRERVKQLAQTMHYQPSEIARSLSSKRSMTIGIIFGQFMFPFYSERAEEIQKQLRKRHYLGLALTANTTEQIKETIETCIGRRVDGLIGSQFSPSDIALLKNAKLPYVLFDKSDPRGDYVCVDTAKGVFLATEHLIKLGYREIGFLCAIDPNHLRVEEFRATMRRYNLPIHEEWIIPGSGYYTGGYSGMKKLLSLDNRPRAILAFNDVAAIGGMRAIREAGLKIPEDLAIVGFDDIEESEYACPPLTTMHQPKAEVAQKIVEILLNNIENPDGREPQQLILEPSLIIRGSCGFHCYRNKKEEV